MTKKEEIKINTLMNGASERIHTVRHLFKKKMGEFRAIFSILTESFSVYECVCVLMYAISSPKMTTTKIVASDMNS